MKLNKYLFHIALILVFITLPACKNTRPNTGANAMRIWIAPAYRSNASVNQSGHVYVDMKNNPGTKVTTAPARIPGRP